MALSLFDFIGLAVTIVIADRLTSINWMDVGKKIVRMVKRTSLAVRDAVTSSDGELDDAS